jgi:hypothetical protein
VIQKRSPLSCPCSALIARWVPHLDVGVCALGHRVPGVLFMREYTRGVLHLYDGRPTAVEELIRARDAGLLTDAEARLVALEMFPAAKQIADAILTELASQ